MGAARNITGLSGISFKQEVHDILAHVGLDLSKRRYRGEPNVATRSAINGETLTLVREQKPDEVTEAVKNAHTAYLKWRHVPPPRRGELIRLFGERVRRDKARLGQLISIEVGKTLSEGMGEVQEVIDVCDFAVGLSRQLHGLTIASERPEHRIMETWHPTGVTGVITAFNFPMAVWSWNAALTLVCGNSVVWKASEKTPLSALALQAAFDSAMAEFGPDAPRGLAQILIGKSELGEALVSDARVPVISATGSTTMGRHVAPIAARRFARLILELGGNNASIVSGSADVSQALRAIAFSAMGTAGQRCTTLRRLIVHSSVYDKLVSQLRRVYASVSIGNPLQPNVLVGPLIDELAYRQFVQALSEAREVGGKVTGGERVYAEEAPNAYYVQPALVEMPSQSGPMLRETFAPILYVVKYERLEEAIELQNAVNAGLSSSIFTQDVREAECFVATGGSDCGIANVNIGPSGAEVGGAFGGEKDSGQGRESGSDSWKGYMRRATNTINYGRRLSLAQGITFPLD